jgi:hypothetical protein
MNPPLRDLGCFVTCAKDYVARMASGATAIFLGTIHHACEIEVGGGRFSWHCDECDADICNRCLQETRNSWACKGSKSRIEDVGDEIDLGILCAFYSRPTPASYLNTLGVMESGQNCRGFRFRAETRWDHSGARQILRCSAGRQIRWKLCGAQPTGCTVNEVVRFAMTACALSGVG